MITALLVMSMMSRFDRSVVLTCGPGVRIAYALSGRSAHVPHVPRLQRADDLHRTGTLPQRYRYCGNRMRNVRTKENE